MFDLSEKFSKLRKIQNQIHEINRKSIAEMSKYDSLMDTNIYTDSREFFYKTLEPGMYVRIYYSPSSGMLSVVTGVWEYRFGHYHYTEDSPPDFRKIQTAFELKIDRMESLKRGDLEYRTEALDVISKVKI